MAALARERARGLLHDGRSRADAGGAREALTLTLALTRTLALTEEWEEEERREHAAVAEGVR